MCVLHHFQQEKVVEIEPDKETEEGGRREGGREGRREGDSGEDEGLGSETRLDRPHSARGHRHRRVETGEREGEREEEGGADNVPETATTQQPSQSDVISRDTAASTAGPEALSTYASVCARGLTQSQQPPTQGLV